MSLVVETTTEIHLYTVGVVQHGHKSPNSEIIPPKPAITFGVVDEEKKNSVG